MLLTDGRTDDARRIAERLGAQANLALDIVEGFRQLMRTGSIERGVVDLRELAQGALELICWKAYSSGISITLEAEGPVPVVHADRNLIRQVILNLLCNALDAMGENKDSIVVMLQFEGNAVALRVRDRGPGLSPDVEKRLFEPFFTTKAAGVGIGLSISRRIIESHGGQLWGRNNAGDRGATFGFTLPVGEAVT
jgi:signal transduction histidine kinase